MFVQATRAAPRPQVFEFSGGASTPHGAELDVDSIDEEMAARRVSPWCSSNRDLVRQIHILNRVQPAAKTASSVIRRETLDFGEGAFPV